MKTLQSGSLARHIPTGIVGVVEKVYAAGEHPTVSCAVVRLSTGDELVLREQAFEEVGTLAVAAFWSFLCAGLRNVVQAGASEAQRRGIDPTLVQPLFRAALAEAFRSSARPSVPAEVSKVVP